MAEAPAVRTEQGRAAGREVDGVLAFLGLPYAAPPVGERRWAPPAPPGPWEGTRDATVFGPAAVQIAGRPPALGAVESEDCLYLNVWTPTLDRSRRLPVMVWIHGGGFLNGAGSMPEWTGENLARRDVCVVSINYRLGAFGFAAHPQSGANAAVLDWVAALGWVARNIEEFGGDPGAVTIFGQSSGAAAVRALLSTPSARGLFHRAIIQSAGFEPYAVVASPSHDRVAAATDALCEQLGSRDLEVLRRIPAEDVRVASLACSGVVPPAGQLHTPANLVWYPTEDGRVVGEDLCGWSPDVNVMVGTTQDEARFFVRPTGVHARPDLDPAAIYTSDTLTRMAAVLAGDNAHDVLADFAARELEPYDALAELITAAVWSEPARASVERFARLDRTFFSYRFARVSPGGRRSRLLAQHGAELDYIFGRVTSGADYDQVDLDLADAMAHAWTEFARTGVPRGPDGTPWPSYTASAPRTLVIADTLQEGTVGTDPITALIRGARSTADSTV